MKLDKSNITLVLIVVMFFWALMHPLSKMIVGDVPPVLLTFLRYGLGTVFLFAYFLASRRSLKIERKDLVPLAIIGIVGNSISTTLYFFGLNLTSATSASILINFSPVVIALFAPFLIGEKFRKNELAGILIAVVGMMLVVDGGLPLGSLSSSADFYGNTIVLVAAFFTATYTIYGKKYVHKYGGFVTSFYTLTFSALALLPVVIFTGDISRVSSLSGLDWFVVTYLGLIAAFIFSIFYVGIKLLGPTKAASFKLLIPVYATIVAILLLGESPSMYTIFGGLIVLGGLYLVHREDLEP